MGFSVKWASSRRRYAGLEQVGFSGVNCNGVEQVIAADMLPMRVRVDHDNGLAVIPSATP